MGSYSQWYDVKFTFHKLVVVNSSKLAQDVKVFFPQCSAYHSAQFISFILFLTGNL